MLNACMYECYWFPLCMMINCICACFSSKSLLKHVVSAILCMHMFMGLLARVVKAWVASFSPIGGLGTWHWIWNREGECQREEYYRCRAQCHCCHHEDPKGRTRRFRGGGASFPLPNVGKGFPATVHCRQWEPKELDFSRGHEAVGFSNHSTPTAVHHWVASPRTRSSCQLAVPPSLHHQALHRWGIMWYCSSWCLWCIIRSTILMEATCYVCVGTRSHESMTSWTSLKGRNTLARLT